MDLKIAVLAGDGIGPEIMEQGVAVTTAIAEKFGHEVTYKEALCGAHAIDEVGDPFPEETFKTCMEADAVLFASVGDPKFDNNPTAKVRPEQGLLAMRKKLGLFANIRPVTTFDCLVHKSPLKDELVRGADFICIRELTGGMYFGEKKEGSDEAYDTNFYSRPEVERILRVAYNYARQRRHHLTVVDKANVLDTSRLWRKVMNEVAEEYPDVTLEHMLVDNCAMQIVKKPSQFDVVVTENMFGDILSDEASMITGSIGMIPSSSLGDGTRGLYEPIHGSAPDIAGQNLANPIGTILAAAMMLKYSFDMDEESAAIEAAVEATLNDGYRTGDCMSEGMTRLGCVEMGDQIIAHLKNR